MKEGTGKVRDPSGRERQECNGKSYGDFLAKSIMIRVTPSELNHGLDETVPEQPSTLNCKLAKDWE